MGRLFPRSDEPSCPDDQYIDRHARYEIEIEEVRERLFATVELSKPITDFCLLISTQVAVTTVFFVLFNRIWTFNSSTHEVLGFVATGILLLILMDPVSTAVNAVVEIGLFKFLRLTGVPLRFHERHVVLRAFWKALLRTGKLAAMWGVGFTFAELLKTQIAT